MILDKIINSRKKDIEELKRVTSIDAFIKQIEEKNYSKTSFKTAIKGQNPKNTVKGQDSKNTGYAFNIIAEVKKASPSKGLICADFDYIQIAKDYEIGGAAAISVLTEPNYFLGKNEYLMQIKEAVRLPLLRKDFTVDAWQIYEAKAIGADAILLIVAALNQKEIEHFLNVADSLELDCLVETHDEEEVKRALDANAQIIGVNNRNLKTFEVSLEVSERLRRLVPNDKIFVAESGIHTSHDMRRLKELGADAALIGESIVKSTDRVAKLKELKEV